MGYRILFCLLTLICFPLIAGNKWHVTLPGGRLSFSGAAIVPACQVDGIEKTVDMGQVSSNRFDQSGEYMSATPFEIRLVNCSPRVSHQVSVAFYGVSNAQLPVALSIGTEDNSATGIAISLADNVGNPVSINSSFQPVWTLLNGTMTLRFVARYVAISPRVTGGKVDATTTFLLTYF